MPDNTIEVRVEDNPETLTSGDPRFGSGARLRRNSHLNARHIYLGFTKSAIEVNTPAIFPVLKD
jgi:hypothetical protein